MEGFADGLDDSTGDFYRPLPKEDRLWRHPSELAGDRDVVADSVAVRKRWIERETSRGSAWTAGIVGAMLATGLVALGTHLATAFTTPPIDGGPVVTTNSTIPTSQLALAGHGASPAITSLSATMTKRIHAIGQSVAIIDVGRGGTNIRCLGIVIRSNGAILAPAVAVAGASSLLVTLANGVQYVGVPQGADRTSGIAVVRINGVKGLPTAQFASSPVSVGDMALAITSSGGSTYSLGTVRSTDVATGRLVDTVSTDVTPVAAPLGSVLMGSNGALFGIVSGSTSTGVVATPSWLASPVANELLATTRVVHGWLGMVSGSTYSRPGSPIASGVIIASIAKNSAASKAGLLVGDVITSLNGSPIDSLAMLRGRLYVESPGTTVHLGIARGSTRLTLSVLLDGQIPD